MADLPSSGKWSKEHDEQAREAGHLNWLAWIEAIEEERGFKICGARAGSKTKPHPCGKSAGSGTDHKGSGRCKVHGGMAVMGPDHPRWVDGSHSLLFKAGGGEKHRAWFDLLLQDQELENLRAEISMLRVRLIELTNNLPGIPTGWDFSLAMEGMSESVEKLRKAVEEKELEKVNGLSDAVQVRLAIMEDLIEPVRVSQGIWDEIRGTVKVLKDVVDTQVRRKKSEYDQASMAELHVWTMRMQQLILQHVPPENVNVVVTEIRQWIGWEHLNP